MLTPPPPSNWKPACTSTLAAICLAALALGCAGGGPPSSATNAGGHKEPGEEPRHQATLTVSSLAGTNRDGLRAELILPREMLAESPIDILFPSSWAGRGGFLQDIQDIQAFTGQSAPARIVAAGPGRLLIHHNGTSPITIRWVLSPETTSYDDTTRFRAINHEGRIFAPAHALLAQPVNLGEHLPVTLALTDGDVVFTPASARQSTFAELVNGAFLAGPWAVSEQICGGERMRIASLDPIPPSRERQICETIRAQRGLHRHSATLIVIAPRQDERTAMTGSSFDGGFVLELPDGRIPESDEFLELVAHEEMHRLIGHRITFDRGSEADILWFLEGTTEYLAFRTLASAGLIGSNRLLHRLEEAMDAVASVSIPRIQPEGLWDDEELRRVHYDRGLLISLALDLTLLDQPATERTLGPGLRGFITWLGQLPADERTNLDLVRLRERLATYAGNDIDAPWFAPAFGTSVPEDLTTRLHQNAGIRVRTRTEDTPTFGMRAAMTASGTWYIVEVDTDSPASRAGLHAGQVLASPPRTFSNGHGAVSALEISLPTPGGQRTLRLSPGTRTMLRHDLDIVDPNAFRSFLRSGDGSTPPRRATSAENSNPRGTRP